MLLSLIATSLSSPVCGLDLQNGWTDEKSLQDIANSLCKEEQKLAWKWNIIFKAQHIFRVMDHFIVLSKIKIGKRKESIGNNKLE